MTAQTNPANNGIYVVSSTTWLRAQDFNGNRDAVKGTRIYTQTGAIWILETADPVQIGSSSLTFAYASEDGVLGDLGSNDVGKGLSLIGTTQGHNAQIEMDDKLSKSDGGTVVGPVILQDVLTMQDAIRMAFGANIASAATTDLSTATGNTVYITGSETIGSFGTAPVGFKLDLIFTGAPTINYNATSMITHTGEDHPVAAGDSAEVVSLGAGNWKFINYQTITGTRASYLFDKTASYVLLSADIGNIIRHTSVSAHSFSFTAAATLGSGWWCYLVNGDTAGDLTLDPNGAELIDGLTSYIMYPGEMRLVTCNGTSFTTKVLHGFAKTFTSSGTFTKPPGYQAFDALGWAGGGSGSANTNNNGAGGGGGGGGFVRLLLSTSFIAATETITIGAGAASVTNTAGNSGGTTSIGSRLIAYGGGGGGYNFNNSGGGGGGGGGGVLSVGAVGDLGPGGSGGAVGGGTGGNGADVGADGSVGGYPITIEGGGGGGGGGSSSSPRIGGAGSSAVYGGGGGGGGVNTGASNTVGAGGFSLQGGNGGAGGKGVAATSGSSPAGGGGGTCNGASSGAGARGEVRIYGVV